MLHNFLYDCIKNKKMINSRKLYKKYRIKNNKINIYSH
jgi:hypothetical protein